MNRRNFANLLKISSGMIITKRKNEILITKITEQKVASKNLDLGEISCCKNLIPSKCRFSALQAYLQWVYQRKLFFLLLLDNIVITY
jgi:hypothetical protein